VDKLIAEVPIEGEREHHPFMRHSPHFHHKEVPMKLKELCRNLNVSEEVVFKRASDVYPTYLGKPEADYRQYQETGILPLYVECYLFLMRDARPYVNGHH